RRVHWKLRWLKFCCPRTCSHPRSMSALIHLCAFAPCSEHTGPTLVNHIIALGCRLARIFGDGPDHVLMPCSGSNSLRRRSPGSIDLMQGRSVSFVVRKEQHDRDDKKSGKDNKAPFPNPSIMFRCTFKTQGP